MARLGDLSLFGQRFEACVDNFWPKLFKFLAFFSCAHCYGNIFRLCATIYSSFNLFCSSQSHTLNVLIPSGSRTFVQAGVYDKFVELAKEKAANRKVGNPWSKEIEQGPQVSEQQFNQILELVSTILLFSD